jgi:excisionase family DNA binding protein
MNKVKTSGDVPSFLELSATTLSELGANPLFTISLTKLEPILKTWIWEVLQEVQPKEEMAKFLTRKEACEVLHVSMPTLSRYLNRGIIKGHKVGYRVLIGQEEINNALREISKRQDDR